MESFEVRSVAVGAALRGARDRLAGSKRVLFVGSLLALAVNLGVAWLVLTGASALGASAALAWALSGVLGAALAAPLAAGVVAASLRRMRGEAIALATLRAGLERAAPAVRLVALLALVEAGLTLTFAPLGSPDTFTGVLVADLPALVWTALTVFCLYVLVDRGADVGGALRGGIAVAWRNFWPLLAIFLVIGCTIVVGALALGIGLVWALPYAELVLAAAYLGAVGGSRAPAEEARAARGAEREGGR